MKKLFTLVFVTLSLLNLQAQTSSVKRKVLFLGDSYTYVNDLPGMITSLALSAGDSLIKDANLIGGYKLIQHFTNSVSTSKIMAGGWDYVVLQEQSQTPALQNGNFPLGAQELCQLVKQYNPCAKPMFYMTWGRKNGDALNCPSFPLMCTYAGMDSLTRTEYTLQASYQNGEVSPVGAVWRYLRATNPALNLYQADNSHPTRIGTYVAACCFYATIFKKSPLLITGNDSLTVSDAATIRNAAKLVVYDSLQYWNFTTNPSTAHFDVSIGTGFNEAILTYTSANFGDYANTFTWNFGDGTFTTSVNPGSIPTVNHSYAANGTYTVTLVISNCDLLGVHQATYQTTVTFCAHNPTIFRTYPWHCPVPDTLSTQVYNAYQWFSNGIALPGETHQHYGMNATGMISVKATLNGCTEQSPDFVNISNPGLYLYDIVTDGTPIGTNKFCIGTAVKLIITALDHTESIQWARNGVPITYGINDTLSIDSSGTYQVSLFHSNCPNYIFYTQQIYCTFTGCLSSLSEVSASRNEFILYPNPTTGYVKVISHGGIETIEIYNNLGEKVQQNNYSGCRTSTELDISRLEKGLYTIRLFDGKVTYTAKLIKL